MSNRAYDERDQETARRRFGVAATARALTLAAGLALTGVAGAVAQESTPAAMGGECVAPEMAAMDTTAAAASPAASPTDDAALAGMPADEALAAEAIAAVENFTACFNAGDIAAGLSLTTPAYLMDLFGTDDVEELVTAFGMTEVPRTEILEIGNVMTYDDGRVSVEAEYMSGDYQYIRSNLFLVQSGDTLLVDDEDYLPATSDGDATIISYTIADDTAPLAFDQSMASPEFPVVILYGANNGAERHSVALLRLPDEAAGTPLAELPAEQVMGAEFIGTVNIDAGEREELVLVGLPVGSYLLVDLLVPDSAAELTITEPEPES